MSPSAEQKSALIEIGWEVCNRVGGIYTVLRTKAPQMVAQHGDMYALLGPLNRSTAQVEFEETDVPEHLQAGIQALADEGIHCIAGRWLVQGRPLAVLIDLSALRQRIPKLRQEYHNIHGLHADADDQLIGDALAFGEERVFLAVWRQDAAASHSSFISTSGNPPLLPQIAAETPQAKHLHHPCDPFGPLRRTTWPGLEKFDTVDAKHRPPYGIGFQHGVECLAAQSCTVFSTVSSTTARECTALLGRTPDVLLPNGINTKRFEVIHEFQGLHQENKNRIHEFSRGYFFPSYDFDLDQTLYMVNSGRFEYRNKGMDLCLDAWQNSTNASRTPAAHEQCCSS